MKQKKQNTRRTDAASTTPANAAPYPAYKPSGVEWLGDVPEHWETKRLKYSFRLLTTKAEEKTNPVALENIESWTGRFIETETEFDGEGIAFKKDDILFGKLRPYLAKVLKTEGDGEAVGDFFVMRPQGGINPDYAAYLLRSEGFIDIIDGSTFGSKMPRASWDFMGSVRISLPPLSEQTAIAGFLDGATGRIDALVDKKKRLVALLREKRTAMISRAVTQGLDPTAKRKPSAVEWLGDIPEHWEVASLRRYLYVRSGDMTSAIDIIDEGFPVFGGNGFRGYIDKWNTEPNTIIIGRYGALCGNVRITQERTWATEHAFRVIALKEFHTDFFAYLLNTLDLNKFSARSAQPGLNSDIVRNNFVAIPPLSEQQAIADYLDKETGKIDALITKVEAAIDKLNEYRTAIISAAVTGKIDVRGFA